MNCKTTMPAWIHKTKIDKRPRPKTAGKNLLPTETEDIQLKLHVQKRIHLA